MWRASFQIFDMAGNREISRGFNPGRKRSRTCPACCSTTCVTAAGMWYRHRMPPMNLGHGMPNYAGPICRASGTKA